MIIGSPENAIKLLSDGGVIGYPTEAVFGLGCDPWNEKSVNRISNIKNRKKNKTFLLVGSNIDQLASLIDVDTISKEARSSWPGHVTWLMPARNDAPSWLIDKETGLIGIRVSDHPVINGICNKFQNPIISTSANISGDKNIKDKNIFISEFKNKVDYLVEGDLGNQDNPSIIINMITNKNIR